MSLEFRNPWQIIFFSPLLAKHLTVLDLLVCIDCTRQLLERKRVAWKLWNSNNIQWYWNSTVIPASIMLATTKYSSSYFIYQSLTACLHWIASIESYLFRKSCSPDSSAVSTDQNFSLPQSTKSSSLMQVILMHIC